MLNFNRTTTLAVAPIALGVALLTGCAAGPVDVAASPEALTVSPGTTLIPTLPLAYDNPGAPTRELVSVTSGAVCTLAFSDGLEVDIPTGYEGLGEDCDEDEIAAVFTAVENFIEAGLDLDGEESYAVAILPLATTLGGIRNGFRPEWAQPIDFGESFLEAHDFVRLAGFHFEEIDIAGMLADMAAIIAANTNYGEAVESGTRGQGTYVLVVCDENSMWVYVENEDGSGSSKKAMTKPDGSTESEEETWGPGGSDHQSSSSSSEIAPWSEGRWPMLRSSWVDAALFADPAFDAAYRDYLDGLADAQQTNALLSIAADSMYQAASGSTSPTLVRMYVR